MLRTLLPLGVATVTLTVTSLGQNLLTLNPDFDSAATANFYQPAAGSYTNTEGWVLTVGSSFGGIASDQGGIGTPRFAYVYGNSKWETAPSARADVVAGIMYEVKFDLRNDGAADSAGRLRGATVFVDWYSNELDFTGLISSSNLGNDIAGVEFVGSGPFVSFTELVTAPAGATAAAIRWTTTDAGGPGLHGQVIGDNFAIQQVPEPTTFGLGMVAGAAMLGLRRRRG